MSKQHWGLLILLSIVWGASFNLLFYLLIYLKPLHIISSRLLIAGISIWIFLIVTKKFNLTLKQVLVYLPMALLNNVVPFMLIAWAMLFVNSSLAAMFIACATIFSIVLSAMFLPDEKLNTKKIIGAFVGLAGVFFLLNPDTILLGFGRNKLPELALLGASLCYATAAVYGKKYGKTSNTKPIVAAALQVTLAGLLVLPLALYKESTVEQLQAINLPILAVFLTLTLFCTLFAQLLYFYLLEHIGSVNTQLTNLLIPLFTILFGVIFFADVIFWYHCVGMLLIGFGMLILDGRVIN